MQHMLQSLESLVFIVIKREKTRQISRGKEFFERTIISNLKTQIIEIILLHSNSLFYWNETIYRKEASK